MVSRKNNLYPKRRSNALVFYHPLTTDSTEEATFITIAESLDIGHYSLKALLNHSKSKDITGQYIQITPERLRVPMQMIADRIMEMARPDQVNDREREALKIDAL